MEIVADPSEMYRWWVVWIAVNGLAGALGGVAIDVGGFVGVVHLGVFGGIAQWAVLRREAPIGPRWIVATAVGNLAGWLATPMYAYVGMVLFLLIDLWVRATAQVGLDVNPNSAIFGPIFYNPLGGTGGAASGLAVAVLQYLSVSGRVRLPKAWVGFSTAGGATAGAIAGLDLFFRAVGRTFELLAPGAHLSSGPTATAAVYVAFPSGAISGAVFGLAYAAVTGVALARWLRRHAIVQ